jgi:hypothetical protein
MEDAERAKVLWGFKDDESAQIEELEVLTIPELPKHNKTPYTVKIHAKNESSPVYVSKGWIEINSAEEGYSFLGDVCRFYIYASSEKEAKETATSYLQATLSKLAWQEQWQSGTWYPVK